ncbi:hypothetical protein Q8791_10530 [Nocardiopsis sp. CT-R113]|uniref:Secreted protein n=1 Tax=Nocardiopsis codii TaxID=3065942 RepID=A0ABU7K5X5_9ACTN|nr:hypothetical protein [Nocardiopsis sp. CT-R113]MEE2037654.1 hypothetical protein [Nocardiopsis sp. CT-R113]
MHLRTLLAATGLAALAVAGGATAATAAEGPGLLGSVRDTFCVDPAAAGNVGLLLEPLTPAVVHCPTPVPEQA